MGRKSLIIYLSTITGGAIVFGLLTNWLIPADFILSKMSHIHGEGHEHEMLPHWLQLASALFLVFSIAGGYLYSIISKKNKMEKVEGITVKVTGMTCSHCEATVKKNLEAIKGITSVIADNKSNTVKIAGSDINLEKVKTTVNGLGYNFVG
jgi:copper chaperone CopZ